MLVQGIHKVCVMGVIKYHQIRQELFEEVSLHPEVLKDLEVLHYHVENNYPVEKELVFKVVPELYTHEINKLGFADRLRFKKPRISYARADGEQLEVDVNYNRMKESELEKLMDKSMQMEMYLLEQTSDVYKMYYDKMRDEVRYGGHVTLREYMIQLDVMDTENMKPWERRMWSEVRELRQINSDVRAL